MSAFRLEDKTVVLTGAGGIIGKAAVVALRGCGARVCALDRSATNLRGLGDHDDSLLTCEADVTDSTSLHAAKVRLEATWGPADVLINNAAAKSQNFFAPFDEFPLSDWNEVMAVNLTGAMLASQTFGSPMAARGSGAIINTLSIYGIVAPDQRIYEGSSYEGRAINTPAVYSASKAGLWGLTQYLATYWGNRGVRTNAVTPGGVLSGQNSVFTDNYSAKVPLGRMARPDDIANAMCFLASDGAAYINGHNLVVDGGWTAW